MDQDSELDSDLIELPRRRRWWIPVVVAGLVGFALVARASVERRQWSFLRQDRDPAEWEQADGQGGGTPEVGPVLRMEDVVVRLNTGGQTRYLAIELDLELSKKRDPKEEAKYLPRLREATLSFLSDRAPEDLRDGTRRQQMKRELVSHLQKVSRGIEAVYISRMVVQQDPTMKDQDDNGSEVNRPNLGF